MKPQVGDSALLRPETSRAPGNPCLTSDRGPGHAREEKRGCLQRWERGDAKASNRRLNSEERIKGRAGSTEQGLSARTTEAKTQLRATHPNSPPG